VLTDVSEEKEAKTMLCGADCKDLW